MLLDSAARMRLVLKRDFLESAGDRWKNEKDSVHSVEQHALVVLKVLVVSARQSLESGK